MRIQIAMKSVARTRNIQWVEYTVKDHLVYLEDLIRNLVEIEIDKYEQLDNPQLTQADINEMVDTGKISFGFKYREHEAINREQSKKIALDAFLDELYVVFINDIKVPSLSTKLDLKEGDAVSLIRLTMLSGRYF